MADTSETAAGLRVTRVKALSGEDRLHVLTYLLAKYPESFAEMLDDALSALSGGDRGSGAGDTPGATATPGTATPG
jgi:hypothetical protein